MAYQKLVTVIIVWPLTYFIQKNNLWCKSPIQFGLDLEILGMDASIDDGYIILFTKSR